MTAGLPITYETSTRGVEVNETDEHCDTTSKVMISAK